MLGLRSLLSHLKELLRKAWKAGMPSDEYVRLLRKRGIRIGNNVFFRDPLHTSIDLTRPCLVEIGDNVDINANFSLMTHDFGTYVFRGYFKDFVNSSGKVKIGNNIVFGRDVTILKGVTIGDNCIIGAGSVISKDIPANSVAVGYPAKVVCSLEDYYQRRKSLQVKEALEYGRELAVYKGGVDKLQLSDFTEEWVLFLSLDEYNNDANARRNVDFRLKGRIDVKEFLNRPKPYKNFAAFRDAIKESQNSITK